MDDYKFISFLWLRLTTIKIALKYDYTYILKQIKLFSQRRCLPNISLTIRFTFKES